MKKYRKYITWLVLIVLVVFIWTRATGRSLSLDWLAPKNTTVVEEGPTNNYTLNITIDGNAQTQLVTSEDGQTVSLNVTPSVQYVTTGVAAPADVTIPAQDTALAEDTAPADGTAPAEDAVPADGTDPVITEPVAEAPVTKMSTYDVEASIAATGLDMASIIEDKATSGTGNIYHWWTAGGEKQAIESIIDNFNNAYTNVTAKSNAIPGGAGGAMVMKVKVLQQSKMSPESFQAHPGEELEPYLSADMLLELGQIWVYDNIGERLLPGLEEMCTSADGNIYIVPVGIHKTNTIYYNIHVFEKYGIDIPEDENITWEQFWSICEQLAKVMPDGEYPIDIGDRKSWPACQVFENIMMGTSAQLYQDFINGRATREQVTEVLDTYKNLLEYVAPDHASRDWFETAAGLAEGKYAMQIMGSWMQPLLTNQGMVYGEDYGVFTFPGTAGYFGLNIDGFVVSKDSKDVAAGIRWAHNVSTTEVQIAFSGLKESVSPYTDTPDTAYANAPRSLEDKQTLTDPNTTVYPSFTHGTALPWSASSDLQSRIAEFAVASDPDTSRFAKLIVGAMNEKGIDGDWDFVKDGTAE